MVYNYISTHFYATCLVLNAWYRVNLETLIFFGLLYHVFTSIQEIKIINENPNNNYDSTNKSWHLFICCLSTIRSQKEILTNRAINYLLNLPDHIIDCDFIYIPWYNLLAWSNE
jgi:hypothetical protein